MSKFDNIFGFWAILILFYFFHFYFSAKDISLNIVSNYMKPFSNGENMAQICSIKALVFILCGKKGNLYCVFETLFFLNLLKQKLGPIK